jgi:redox-sensitive bicupin YhaK (pirin superfamily)
MSSTRDLNPLPEELETIIVPRARDLGDGFQVRRALPAAQRQMVGPFIFFDQMGPTVFRDGRGLDVRPHPHIGLATVTYLFDGALIHRDSLGTVGRIEPGEVNWMTAGSGIVHSERSPIEERTGGGRLFGIQIWVALPRRHEETAPSFAHFGSDQLPRLEDGGARIRLIAGSLFGARSPVPTRSEMFYADVMLEEGAVVALKAEHDERAAYVVEGRLEVGSALLEAGDLPVFRRSGEVLLRAAEPSRLLLLGGEPMEGPRHIVWNFVSSSPERIQQAKDDWRAQRFARVPDETEFIPLPDNLPTPVSYP